MVPSGPDITRPNLGRAAHGWARLGSPTRQHPNQRSLEHRRRLTKGHSRDAVSVAAGRVATRGGWRRSLRVRTVWNWGLAAFVMSALPVIGRVIEPRRLRCEKPYWAGGDQIHWRRSRLLLVHSERNREG